jgi:phosphoadenosine phosphosulfate reductase
MQGSKGMIRDFRKWPTFYKNYLRAFDKMQEGRKADGLNCNWDKGLEVMAWWLDISMEQMTALHEEIINTKKEDKQ